MSIKFIALDLDGTLTNSQKKITSVTREVIDQARDKGIQIILASGRPHIGIKYVAEELDVYNKGGYILSFNGGRIVDCLNNTVVYERTISEECYKDICQCTKKFDGVTTLTYDAEGIITEDAMAKYVKQEAFNCSIPIRQVKSLYREVNDKNIVKFMIVGEHERLENVRHYLQEKYTYQLSIYYSEKYFLEIMAPNISKDKSLEFLLNKLGDGRESLMACGDGLNDLPMLKYAGLSVAMENACYEVKQVADFVTRSNDEDGVAYAIKSFVLNN